MIPRETLDRLLQLGGDLKPQTCGADGEPFVVLPAGMETKSLAHLMPPTRIKQSVRLLEAESFIDYVGRFKTPDTLIFANVSETGACFQAVLDYHNPEKPAWCQHRATFELIETPEWKSWMSANRKSIDQVQFATWLEDNSKLVVEPAAADLLEMVRTLHGHSNARFNTALRLDNGAYSVCYDEDVVVKGNSSARAGEFELPPTIAGGFSIFQGCEPYRVTARLKSRTADRKLMLWFETIAVADIVRESIMLAVKQIADKTGIIPLLGNP